MGGGPDTAEKLHPNCQMRFGNLEGSLGGVIAEFLVRDNGKSVGVQGVRYDGANQRRQIKETQVGRSVLRV